MFDRLKNIILDYAEIEEDALTPETNLRTDCGLDSFTMVTMIGVIEKEFNVTFSDRDLNEIYTVQDVIKFIESHQ